MPQINWMLCTITLLLLSVAQLGCNAPAAKGKLAASQGTALSMKPVTLLESKKAKADMGDVYDRYQAAFEPVPDVDHVVQAAFFVDTGGLDWFDGNCLQNHEDCMDF